MTATLESIICSPAQAAIRSADVIASTTHTIYETALRESQYLDGANFRTIHPDDIERLFDLYDRQFFQGQCRLAVAQVAGGATLDFRLSPRMTQAGGKTGRRELRHRNGAILRTSYEIAVSTTLLFQTFQDEQRPITVTGLVCRDRLQALQRVMEHEIIHLIEMLLWRDSRCSASRFQTIARSFFGHTEHTHRLITPRERAYTKYGVRTGDRVSFRMDGQHLVGIVNRITKRATVLVEQSTGRRFSDGKHYETYYVPVGMLTPEPKSST